MCIYSYLVRYTGPFFDRLSATPSAELSMARGNLQVMVSLSKSTNVDPSVEGNLSMRYHSVSTTPKILP